MYRPILIDPIFKVLTGYLFLDPEAITSNHAVNI